MPDGDSSVKVVWAPQPGPQHALIDCPLPEILFGGARGGGKSDAVLGKYAAKALRYGQYFNAIIFRKELPQADDLIERAKEIYLEMGATYREVSRGFRLPGGGRLRFRPLENTADARKYQGQNLCVAVGTRVLMADGFVRPIESVAVGEFVQTLEGPRAVLGKTHPYQAPCVSARVWNSSGALIGEQVHPVWHPVLTTVGISRPAAALECSSLPDCASTAEPTSSRTSLIPGRSLRHPPESGAPREATGESRHSGGPGISAWCAYSAGEGSDYRASWDDNSAMRRPGSWCVPVVLHAPSVRSSPPLSRGGRASAILSLVQDRLCERLSATSQAMQRTLSDLRLLLSPGQLALDQHGALCGALVCVPWSRQIASGYPADCRSFRRLCGGPPRRAAETCRGGTPLSVDVAGCCRSGLSDVLGTTQTRIPTSQLSWVHAYSGEARCLVEDVTWGTMECRLAGSAWVTDLCVAGANHYITETGLINKNTDCAIEEAGNYDNPQAIDMLFGAMRSHTGVPIQLLLTANPGGPGQQWIKHRYIDPAPQGMKVLLRPLSHGREHRYIYIPSRVQDNRILMRADPGYINRLHLVGSPELVRAWLEGDWSVVAGAFFPEFNFDRHVVRPRSLPRYWSKFRSFDWGSARPFCVQWWTVSDGELPEFPRGALIMYREWYGAPLDAGGNTVPNTGLRLTAEEVADRIKHFEAADLSDGKVMSGVADPSIFAESGGPSIAARMALRGCFFREADNTRVGKLGAVGGWDQVRARLKGDGERPAIYFFSTCRDTIRTLPAQQHDEGRPEDLATDGEDHCADSIRYACLSRPYVAPLPAEALLPEPDKYARKSRKPGRRRGSAMAA